MGNKTRSDKKLQQIGKGVMHTKLETSITICLEGKGVMLLHQKRCYSSGNLLNDLYVKWKEDNPLQMSSEVQELEDSLMVEPKRQG